MNDQTKKTSNFSSLLDVDLKLDDLNVPDQNMADELLSAEITKPKLDETIPANKGPADAMEDTMVKEGLIQPQAVSKAVQQKDKTSVTSAQINAEKTLLLKLQQQKEKTQAQMKKEDLEYPDIDQIKEKVSSENNSDESLETQGTSDEGEDPSKMAPLPFKKEAPSIEEDLPSLDALSINDDIDISDIAGGVPTSAVSSEEEPSDASESSKEDDDFDPSLELTDEEMETPPSKAANLNNKSEGPSDQGSQSEFDEATSKRDLLRLKRKKAVEEKKRKREEELRRQEEEKRQREEFDKQNNIFSIEELKKQANQNKSEDFIEEEEIPSNSVAREENKSNKDTAQQIAQAQKLLAQSSAKNTNKQTGPSAEVLEARPVQYSVNHYDASGGVMMGPPVMGPPRKWYVALGLTVGLMIGEILKVATPALIVGFFLLKQQDTHTNQKAINHMLSGNQFEVELGLSLLKNNFTAENNQHYYDLVKMKIDQDIDEVWKVEEFSYEQRHLKVKSLALYSFVDEKNNIDLRQYVRQKMESYERKAMETYEKFYNTEMKENQVAAYVDHLRQANIFMNTKECIKSYEQFGKVKEILNDSFAAKYGQVMAFNCAVMKDPVKAIRHFEQQIADYNLIKMKERIALLNKTAKEEDKIRVAEEQKNSQDNKSESRTPASVPSSGPSNKKNKRY